MTNRPPGEMNPPIEIVGRAIGIVHSRFTSPIGVPIQTARALDQPGSIEVFAKFEAGLRDIQHFEYLIFLTHLHRYVERPQQAGESPLAKVPLELQVGPLPH